MDEQDKYYTPSIEEFHVGFEYEMKENFTDGTLKTQKEFDNSKWIKRVCDLGLPYIERSLNGKNSKNGLCGIRVKYLDKEDIKSLEWVIHQEATWRKIINGKFIYITLRKSDREPIILIWTRNDKTLFSDWETMFNGFIKNKSELKRLLKQLNIYDR